VFTSNTIEMGELPVPAETVQMSLPKLQATVDGGAINLPMTDEAPTLQNDVLTLMRLLVAVDDVAAGDALVSSFGLRLRDLRVVAVEKAADELARAADARRRFDVVVVVQPKNTISGSQQLAAVAARAKSGVVVVSDVADFGRLPGVKAIIEPPQQAAGLIGIVEKVLADRARGAL
jgi:hypothetical protein